MQGIYAVAVGSQTMKRFSRFTPLPSPRNVVVASQLTEKLMIFQGWDHVISLSTVLPRTFPTLNRRMRTIP